MNHIIFSKNDLKIRDMSKEQQKYLMVVCDRYIEFSRSVIESSIDKLPHINETLQLRILSILNQHQPIAKTFVEEG
jgi:heptaprenyl diphosphate synthase